MATISNTPRPGYVWDSTDNVWYPIGVGAHQHTNAADTPAVIPNALGDAKGDLLTATADNTPARLAVGSNGDTLVADSSTSTGLRYNPPVSSLTNPVINGGFDIWQRGTSIVPGPPSTYGPDRWVTYRGVTGATVSRQTVSDTTNLPTIQYCARVQRNSGDTSTSEIWVVSSLENAQSTPFLGKTVTVSFYARAGANFSGANLRARLFSGSGTDQNYVNSFTGQTTVASIDQTLTTTWTRYVITGVPAATQTQLAVGFFITPSGTAGANDWYEVTGVQIDLGTYTASTAPAFRRAGGTIAGELAACQRYYWQQGGAIYNGLGPMGFTVSTSQANSFFVLPVEMRTVPSITWANLQWRQWNNNGYLPSSIVVTGSGLSTTKVIRLEVYVSGVTANIGGYLEINGYLNGYLGLSAEL
jgi:hypothetical protein